jgi:5-methylcytosine-specific restriction endonuclease McrA
MALRADRQGAHRVAFDKNKKIILKTQNVCGICGKPVDKRIKYPDPMSPVVDHIIPINKGGHPSDISNLQLAHWSCNRQKSDKLFKSKQEEPKILGNRNLPQSLDWASYKH